MKTLIFKNGLIHLILVPFYFLTQHEVAKLPTEKLDTLLLFVGLIVIAPITTSYVYKYKDAVTKRAVFNGHVTTFLSVLVIGMLFITLDVLLVEMIGNVLVFRIALLLFWIAAITFDVADFSNRYTK